MFANHSGDAISGGSWWCGEPTSAQMEHMGNRQLRFYMGRVNSI